MKISICLTTFNEEGSIGSLLESLIVQTKKFDEIIIVDGYSTDKTVEIIRHFQKKDSRIKLLVERCSRARGRNLGIEIAKNEIIVITDAGCVAKRDWIENITKPFIHDNVGVVAGFYDMIGKTNLQKAMSVFLGVTPRKFNINFLPSTRSMAFRKNVWEMVGGFPEKKYNTAEDTDFNYKVVKMGVKYARVKEARVEWGMPESLKEFYLKVRSYANWDIKYGIWWHPVQRLMSHNIKSLTVLGRYVTGIVLLLFSIKYDFLFPIILILLFVYLFWSMRKVHVEFNRVEISLLGPVVQITSDLAVMAGFLSGILGR